MFNDEKVKYLFSFKQAFADLCGGDDIASTWEMAMWSNAHMYHGQGASAEEGAKYFFNEIMRYESNRKKLEKLQNGR